MERFEVRFLQSALEDLEDIVLYIASDSKKEAYKMRELIIQKATDLETFPKRGRYVPDKKIEQMGYRMLTVGKYVLFYKVDKSMVYIHRILHGARNYPQLFSGIK